MTYSTAGNTLLPQTLLLPDRQSPKTVASGVLLALIVSGAAFTARNLPGLGFFSPMILAVIIGALFSNVAGLPAQLKPGVGFCQRSLLRLAIVLLGFQLTVGQLVSVGGRGVAIIAASLVATFLFTKTLGRFLGVDRRLAELIAAGTSICGASAIVATNTVTKGSEDEVAYAVAAITLFGTLAMLVFPLLGPHLGLDQHRFGLWAGASIHEIAQVIGASFQNGAQSGEIGTVAKLARVAMLAPVVLMLGLFSRRGLDDGSSARPPVPWFIFAFVAVVALNSAVEIPTAVTVAIAPTTTLMLTMGLAAMGLQTRFSQIRALGFRPLLLAFSASVFIAGFSLLLLKLV